MLKAALERMSSAVSDQALLRGQAHHRAGDVLMLRFSDGLMRARVKSDNHHIYDVYMDLKRYPQEPARCKCPKKTNCEHLLAALYALNAREIGESFDKKSSSRMPAMSYSKDDIVVADDAEWYSSAKLKGHDFFAYELGIMVDGKPVSIVPLVASLLFQFSLDSIDRRPDEEKLHIPIPSSGKVLEVPLGRIKPLIKLLLQYGLKKKDLSLDAIQLSRYQLLFMEEVELAIEASRARWQGTKAFRELHKALLNPEESSELTLPKQLNAELRPYQVEGVNWVDQLRSAKLGGILADDMGLGKTLQTLAFLLREKEEGRLKRPSLILAPRSVMGNWKLEANRFTPSLKVLTYHGLHRHESRNFNDYDLIISTYGVAQRDKNFFIKHLFYYMVLDEAQVIKNTQTKTRQIIQQLRAEQRLCLTGTPLENHLGELWSLFHFLAPGFLGTQTQFREHYQVPIERHQDEAVRDALVKRLKPFVLRRSKNEVATELPEKTEMLQSIELYGAQRDLYESIRLSTEQSVRDAIADQGLAKSQWVFLEALLKLRQVCCDPRLVTEEQSADFVSAKLEALMTLIDGLMDEGRSVLVFSQFTSMLSLIQKALDKKSYSYLTLTGKTRNREALIERFQNGEAPIFLISLRAGGVGVNLTQADTVIHYDPWWNPAVETQATDRTHRLGQDKPVFVYRLIGKGTVEEVMMKMQADKRSLFDSIFSNDILKSTVREWNEEDIASFFMPLEDL